MCTSACASPSSTATGCGAPPARAEAVADSAVNAARMYPTFSASPTVGTSASSATVKRKTMEDLLVLCGPTQSRSPAPHGSSLAQTSGDSGNSGVGCCCGVALCRCASNGRPFTRTERSRYTGLPPVLASTTVHLHRHMHPHASSLIRGSRNVGAGTPLSRCCPRRFGHASDTQTQPWAVARAGADEGAMRS